MIAAWMLSAVLVGLLVTAGATAADSILVSFRRPVRFVWLAAMLATAAWPAIAYVRAHRGTPAAAAAPLAIGVQRAATIVVRASERALHIPFDTVLLAAWALLSTLLCARTIYALAALRARGRLWREHSVDGVVVRLSRDVGPAVVGLGSMDVVLPEWALQLDTPLRSLVLRHEQEHRRARDPYLLLASALLSTLMPWNVALWWQSRRLRLAIELDCDARVLRADPRPERYGLLLLAIAQRRTATHSLLAPALSEPTSNLERRINAMRIPLNTPSRARLAMLGGIAATAIVVACAIDAPTPPAAVRPAEVRANVADTGYSVTLTRETPTGPVSARVRLRGDTIVRRPEPAESATMRARAELRTEPGQEPAEEEAGYKEFQVTKSVRQLSKGGPQYPADLKAEGVEGEVLASFVVDTSGHAIVSTFKVLKSSRAPFGAAVETWLPTAQFAPAEINGRKVAQVVQLPFAFSMK